MDNDREILYQAFQQVNEQRKRKNFDAFMTGLEGGLVMDLDKTYASGDKEKYEQLLSNIKSRGIRVFRNSAGKHQVKFI